jgi:hypothetical protein
MQEFTSVSASSYDPAALAAKLTEKSAEGWSVVSIVPTGGDVTAFLSREATGATAATAAATAAASVAAAAQPAAAAEPAGWAVAPEAVSPTPAVVTPEPAVVTPEPAVVAPAQPVQQAATPAVPAGWYADPAGRFELRYWDGDKWTEHVSRAGQQYTDPPVA